jgi:hypothetical protein
METCRGYPGAGLSLRMERYPGYSHPIPLAQKLDCGRRKKQIQGRKANRYGILFSWMGGEAVSDGHCGGWTTESPTHKVNCFKNRVALEIEWNNKDPFFDRDLNNFRLLFDLRVASVGVIITRCDELQDIFDGLGRGSSFGNSTTHMSKLLPRINGGSGGGCPILVFGITKELYVED